MSLLFNSARESRRMRGDWLKLSWAKAIGPQLRHLRVNIMHVILFKESPAYSAVIHHFEVSYNKVAIMIFLLLLLISYGMLQCNESEIWQTICHLAEEFLSLSPFRFTEQLLLADDFNTNKQLCLSLVPLISMFTPNGLDWRSALVSHVSVLWTQENNGERFTNRCTQF